MSEKLRKFANNLRMLAETGAGHPAAALTNAAQAIDDLLAQLDAATQRAEAAEAKIAELHSQARHLVDSHNKMAESATWESARKVEFLQRAEAAEAKLAAVPVGDIDLLLSVADFPFGHGAERKRVAAWLAQQDEVQP